MRAVTFDHYGPLEDLRLRDDVPRPEAGPGQVLVRVQMAALHAGDTFAVRGEPFVVRMATGWRRPRVGIPGYDFAGVVEAVGAGVVDFRVGDAVFGASEGAAAEFVVAKTEVVARRPDELDVATAAALPTSGLAALHAMRDVAAVESGDEILINGAAGAVGHFAVQIAAAMGARVTAVAGPASGETLRELGAHAVIDYTREDFTTGGTRFDAILDNVENRSMAEVRRAAKPDGTIIFNSGTGRSGAPMVVRMFLPLILSPVVRQKLRRYLSEPNRADLEQLAAMVARGEVRPWIDRTVGLDGVSAALVHIAGGHAHGKTVVHVSD